MGSIRNLIAFKPEDIDYSPFAGWTTDKVTNVVNLGAVKQFALVGESEIVLIYGAKDRWLSVKSPSKCSLIRRWIEENEWT